jgi:hypothetical protein
MDTLLRAPVPLLPSKRKVCPRLLHVAALAFAPEHLVHASL